MENILPPNPFADEPLPKAFYHPSNKKYLREEERKTALEPERLQYADDPVKERYERHLNEEFLRHSHTYLNRLLTTADAKHPNKIYEKFEESWPNSERPSSYSIDEKDIGVKKTPNAKAAPPKQKGRESKQKTEPKASDVSPSGSTLAKYIDRFRHGTPLSREDRERRKPSGANHEDFWWLSTSDSMAGGEDRSRTNGVGGEGLGGKRVLSEPSGTSTPIDEGGKIQRRTPHVEASLRSKKPESERGSSGNALNEFMRREKLKERLLGEASDAGGVLNDSVYQLQQRADKLLETCSTSVNSSGPVVSTEGLGSTLSSECAPSSNEQPYRPQFTKTPLTDAGSAAFKGDDSAFTGRESRQAHGRDGEDILLAWRRRRKLEEMKVRAASGEHVSATASLLPRHKNLDCKVQASRQKLNKTLALATPRSDNLDLKVQAFRQKLNDALAVATGAHDSTPSQKGHVASCDVTCGDRPTREPATRAPATASFTQAPNQQTSRSEIAVQTSLEEHLKDGSHTSSAAYIQRSNITENKVSGNTGSQPPVSHPCLHKPQQAGDVENKSNKQFGVQQSVGKSSGVAVHAQRPSGSRDRADNSYTRTVAPHMHLSCDILPCPHCHSETAKGPSYRGSHHTKRTEEHRDKPQNRERSGEKGNRPKQDIATSGKSATDSGRKRGESSRSTPVPQTCKETDANKTPHTRDSNQVSESSNHKQKPVTEYVDITSEPSSEYGVSDQSFELLKAKHMRALEREQAMYRGQNVSNTTLSQSIEPSVSIETTSVNSSTEDHVGDTASLRRSSKPTSNGKTDEDTSRNRCNEHDGKLKGVYKLHSEAEGRKRDDNEREDSKRKSPRIKSHEQYENRRGHQREKETELHSPSEKHHVPSENNEQTVERPKSTLKTSSFRLSVDSFTDVSDLDVNNSTTFLEQRMRLGDLPEEITESVETSASKRSTPGHETKSNPNASDSDLSVQSHPSSNRSRRSRHKKEYSKTDLRDKPGHSENKHETGVYHASTQNQPRTHEPFKHNSYENSYGKTVSVTRQEPSKDQPQLKHSPTNRPTPSSSSLRPAASRSPQRVAHARRSMVDSSVDWSSALSSLSFSQDGVTVHQSTGATIANVINERQFTAADGNDDESTVTSNAEQTNNPENGALQTLQEIPDLEAALLSDEEEFSQDEILRDLRRRRLQQIRRLKVVDQLLLQQQ